MKAYKGTIGRKARERAENAREKTEKRQRQPKKRLVVLLGVSWAGRTLKSNSDVYLTRD